MSSCPKFTYDQIAQFSKKDADVSSTTNLRLMKYHILSDAALSRNVFDQNALFQNFATYEEWLGKYAKHMEKLLDVIPPGESLMSYARMGVGKGLLLILSRISIAYRYIIMF